LGEVIKSDYNNLTDIYKIYSLDQSSLNKLLADNGETLEDYIFIDELSYAIYFYTEEDITQEPDFDTKLVEYLTQVSGIRGFEVDKEDLLKLMVVYEISLDDFETVVDLKDFMGDVIKSDLSNLSYFKENYELDKQELLDLLADNNKDINSFIYIDDLEQYLWTNSDLTPGLTDSISELLPYLMKELGIDETEISKLMDHFSSLEEHMSNPDVEAKLIQTMERLSSLATEITDTPSNAQINEIVSLYEEVLHVFKLKVEFYLVIDGTKTSVTLAELFKMSDLDNGVLNILLLNSNGELLVDYTVSPEILESLLANLGGYIKDAEEEIIDKVDNNKPAVKPSTTKSTVKGGELPVTATNTASFALVGIILLLVGALVIWKTNDLQNGKN
jgi:processed acidic surface protein